MTLTNQQFRKFLTDAIEERKAHDRKTRKANLLKEGYTEASTDIQPSTGVPDMAMQKAILGSEHLRLWVEDIIEAGGSFPGSPPTWPAKVGNAIIREFGLIRKEFEESYRYDPNADKYDRNRDQRGMSDSTIQFEKISAQGYSDGIRGNQIDPRYAKNGDYMIAYNAGQERLAAREEVDVE